MRTFDSPTILDKGKSWFPWLILLSVIYCNTLASASAVAGFVVDPRIRGALMLSADNMRWISISFVMMLGLAIPLAVFAAERFGYKRAFFLGALFFAVGSFFNGLSSGFISFLLSRILAGAGGGMIFPLSIAILDQTFPKAKLPMALAIYVAFLIGIGSAIGSLGGGYLAQYIHWQAPFLALGCLMIPALCFIWFFHEETEGKIDRTFDYRGYLAFVLFVAALLLALNNGKAEWNTGGWTSPFILTCASLAFVGFILLLVIEKNEKEPFIIFSLFKERSFVLGSMACAFLGAGVYSTQIIFADYLNLSLKYETHITGAFLVSMALSLGFFSVLTAFLSRKIDIRLLTLAGLLVVTITFFWNTQITIYSNPLYLKFMLMCRSAGIGLALGPATALAISQIPPALSGSASLLIVFFRQIGGTVGSVIAGDIIIERDIFHKITFGSQMNPVSPRFQEVVQRLQDYFVLQRGMEPESAHRRAIEAIQNNILVQSQATAIGDAFYIFGVIFAFVTLLLCLEIGIGIRRRKKLF